MPNVPCHACISARNASTGVRPSAFFHFSRTASQWTTNGGNSKHKLVVAAEGAVFDIQGQPDEVPGFVFLPFGQVVEE